MGKEIITFDDTENGKALAAIKVLSFRRCRQ